MRLQNKWVVMSLVTVTGGVFSHFVTASPLPLGYYLDDIHRNVLEKYLGDSHINFPGASANGINDQSDVVGDYWSGGKHGYLMTGRNLRNITNSYGFGFSASDINNAGTVVGSFSYWPAQHFNSVWGYVYKPGAGFINLVHAGNGGSAAFGTTELLGINDGETIVGCNHQDGAACGQGFVYQLQTNQRTELAAGYAPTGINNVGTIVGNHDGQGFVFSNGSYKKFSVPGSKSTSVHGINDGGNIVGSFTNAHDYTSAFAWYGGVFRFYDIGFYDVAISMEFNGINNQGSIVGDYVSQADGYTHAIKLNPYYYLVPEPSGCALLGSGLLGLLACRKRKWTGG